MHKYIGIWGRLSGVAAIVLWDGRAPAGYNNIYSWRDFMDFGDDLAYDAELESRLAYQQPGHCSSIIYTSGTTGNPKGVMISHDNIVWTVAVIIDNFSVSEHDRIVSYLPLSHIAAQMIDIYGPVVVGLCVYFADKNALKGTLKDSLRK
jgi:long-chain-fatty-acid--CoA ligase ACSBG